MTQRYQIIIYPLQSTSAPALPSEVQSYSLWRRHSRLQTYILPPSDIRSLHRPRLTSSHANRMKTLDSEIKQTQAISSVKQCGHQPKSIAPSKITILLKSLFIAQTKNTVKPCGHHPQSIASNEKQTQNTHTHKSNPVVVAGFIIVISDTAISVHSSVIFAVLSLRISQS